MQIKGSNKQKCRQIEYKAAVLSNLTIAYKMAATIIPPFALAKLPVN
jgi:hypothetical protein